MVLFTQPLRRHAFLDRSGWTISTHVFPQYVADGLVDTYYAKSRAQCKVTRSFRSGYDYPVVELLVGQENSHLKMERETAPGGIGH
jgi:hypothetical protein